MQAPPAFSAIKIDGERAYDLARAGEVVEIAPRPVYVEALQLIESTEETATLEMTCEKGTDVRSLARDLARHLRHFRPCCRTSPHRRWPVLRGHRGRLIHAGSRRKTAIRCSDRVSAGLTGLAEICSTPEQVGTVRHGNPVLLTGAAAPIALDECWASCAGAAVALGRVEFGQFRPRECSPAEFSGCNQNHTSAL